MIYLFMEIGPYKCVPDQGRLQDFSQGGARFLGTKNLDKRNKKFTREAREFSRVARYSHARSAFYLRAKRAKFFLPPPEQFSPPPDQILPHLLFLINS